MTVSRIPEGRFAGRCGSTYGCLKKGGFMVLDIILVAILVFFAAKGLAKGFVYTCLHTLGWIAGDRAGLVCCKAPGGHIG